MSKVKSLYIVNCSGASEWYQPNDSSWLAVYFLPWTVTV